MHAKELVHKVSPIRIISESMEEIKALYPKYGLEPYEPLLSAEHGVKALAEKTAIHIKRDAKLIGSVMLMSVPVIAVNSVIEALQGS